MAAKKRVISQIRLVFRFGFISILMKRLLIKNHAARQGLGAAQASIACASDFFRDGF
jgi:hypothetical protein